MVLNNLKAIENCSFNLSQQSFSKEFMPPVILSDANRDGAKHH